MDLTRTIWRRQLCLALTAMVVHAHGVAAQQPVPVPGQSPQSPGPPPLAAYRPPALALAQPAVGGTVQQDRPIVVFRFAAGEPNDPIDLASFAVTIDGRDRTRSFQVTSGEAWGSLAGEASATGDPFLALGTHQLSARICSARGACGVLVTSLTVVPSQLQSPTSNSAAEGVAGDSSASSRRRRVVDAVLAALRKLLSP